MAIHYLQQKRYVGHKYEEASKYKLTFMGIALKRRDYAASQSDSSSALQILLNEKVCRRAAEVVFALCAEILIEGESLDLQRTYN